MGKLPEYIAINTLSLACPRCKVKPGKVCDLLDGDVEIVHVERIAAAAALDVKARKLTYLSGVADSRRPRNSDQP